MISPVMSELQLECSAAERQTKDLMSKADSEHRCFAQQFTNIPYGVIHGLRIARAVREKQSVT
jgi:hypothetical protein